MIFTLAFGETPTEPYAPLLFFAYEYGYGSEAVPQPLNGQYNLVRPEQAFMKNMPSTVKLIDAEGSVGGSRGYDFTYNSQGYPTKATSLDTYIAVTYNCN